MPNSTLKNFSFPSYSTGCGREDLGKKINHKGLEQGSLPFLKKYKNIKDRERERERDRQRVKQSPCREPDVGLDPGPWGSGPEPKADAQPLSHPGIPGLCLFKISFNNPFIFYAST